MLTIIIKFCYETKNSIYSEDKAIHISQLDSWNNEKEKKIKRKKERGNTQQFTANVAQGKHMRPRNI